MIADRLPDLLGLPPTGFAERQAAFEAGAPALSGLEHHVLHGLPRESLRRVATRIGGDAERAAAIEHSIVPKTTLARRGGGKLTVEESERTARLARLFAQAVDAFGTEEEARLFLRRPHPMLEGRPPLQAALTEIGARRVEAILHAVEYGLPV
jgi:putative toxin-antitoxin system antitoxin component (TIGR02293 family)